MKRLSHSVKWFVLIVFLVVAGGMASDIQRGITFSTTEHITNTKLHNLIDEATINTTFVTDKSSAQPAASDVFLFVQPGTPIYRKTTYNTLLLSATNLITSQGEQDLPVTNDYALIFDTSAGGLAKTPLISIFTNSAGILGGLPDYTNWPAGGFSYWYGYQGNGGRIEHSNLFAGWWQWEQMSTNVAASNPLTNPPVLSVHTTPTNADMLVIWDALHQTNKATTLAGLVTNLPAARPGLTNGDTFSFIQTRTNAVNQFGTNAVLSKMTLADLFTNLYMMPLVSGGLDETSRVSGADTVMIWSTGTNASPDATNFPAKIAVTNLVARRFVTNGIPLVSGVAASGNHLLLGTPSIVKWYMVCTNNDAATGYIIGDKIPVEAAVNAAGGTANFAGGAGNVLVFIKARTATPTIPDKTGTGASVITAAVNWNLQCEAEFWPWYR